METHMGKTKDARRADGVRTFLRASSEPWVRWGALALDGKPASDKEVKAAHRATLEDARIQRLVADCGAWPAEPARRHNDAKLIHHKLGLLVDLGLTFRDPGMQPLVDALLSRRSEDGALLSLVELPKAFGGSGDAEWLWMICDAPLLLHALLGRGVKDARVRKAAHQLAALAGDQGWPCASSMPRFRGPGRKDEPCPYANLIALRALSLSEEHRQGTACRAGTEMLLGVWERRAEQKLRMFGIGTDFSKLKYPTVWFDLLHVVDVLSRFEWTHQDARFKEMLAALLSKADADGRYVPESVWMAYKGFDFAQKKAASPTLTLAVERVRARCRS